MYVQQCQCHYYWIMWWGFTTLVMVAPFWTVIVSTIVVVKVLDAFGKGLQRIFNIVHCVRRNQRTQRRFAVRKKTIWHSFAFEVSSLALMYIFYTYLYYTLHTSILTLHGFFFMFSKCLCSAFAKWLEQYVTVPSGKCWQKVHVIICNHFLQHKAILPHLTKEFV